MTSSWSRGASKAVASFSSVDLAKQCHVWNGEIGRRGLTTKDTRKEDGMMPNIT